jgi:hypothetical protein
MAVGKTVKLPEEKNCRSRIAKRRDFKDLGEKISKVDKKTDINVFLSSL